MCRSAVRCPQWRQPADLRMGNPDCLLELFTTNDERSGIFRKEADQNSQVLLIERIGLDRQVTVSCENTQQTELIMHPSF